MKRLLFFLMILLASACRHEQKTAQPVIGPTVGLSLQKADYADIKNFERDELWQVIAAMEKNCRKIVEKPQMTQQAIIKVDPKAYVEICRLFDKDTPQTTEQMRQFLQENFQPYLVLDHLQPQGKFTSYYEAEIKASFKKHGQYAYPVYGRPVDLIEVNLQDFDKSLPNRRLLMRVDAQKGLPYYTRAEIEKGGVDAPVILWADDPVDVFLMQIQGSAVAELDNGEQVRVSYAENNGHNFVGIGSILLKKGLLKSGEASMDKIRDWLKANPQQAKVNMSENPRFIFHRISDADGPVGAMGVTLTAGRSMAVDPSYIPLGSLLWLETKDPYNRPLEKLMIAQDIGGAIKGAVRGDYFWGHGEEALMSAGKMNSAGKYYILLPKNTEVSVRDNR